MAKKKELRHIHIHPASNGYTVGHAHASSEPMMDSGSKNDTVFGHHERAKLHAHIDKLMDGHEGAGSEPGMTADMPNVPKNHSLHNLRRKAM
jgi:hypothetical protein